MVGMNAEYADVIIDEQREPGWTWVWTTAELSRSEKHPQRGRVYRIFLGPFKLVDLGHDEVVMSVVQGDVRGLKLYTAIARINGLVGS